MLDIKAMPHIADIPRIQAERRPDAAAFWYKGTDISFAELERRSNQVAQGLVELGVQPDQRIGYLAKNTAVYYEMMFGSAKGNSTRSSFCRAFMPKAFAASTTSLSTNRMPKSVNRITGTIA